MGLGEEEETFWLMEDAEAEPVCAEVANSAVHTGFYLLVVGGGAAREREGGLEVLWPTQHFRGKAGGEERVW